MPDLKAQFDEAVQLVKTATGDFKPSQELQLKMYSLFKQATEGDVHGKKPGFTDFVGKAKYGAWQKLKGMSKEDAMQQYVDQVNQLKAELS